MNRTKTKGEVKIKSSCVLCSVDYLSYSIHH